METEALSNNQNATAGTALAKTSPGGAVEKWNATGDQIQLLKNTVCRGASDDEFGLFMTVASHMGLDPFLKQIHAVQRWDPDLERKVMTIQVGIDGYRLIAERSGAYAGQEGPYWCGEDGEWKDVWLAGVAPAAAKVIVWRTDKPRPFVATALWSSYVQMTKTGVNSMWRKHGPGQLAKCAEALAFRKAFPVEIGGAAHVDEELDFIDAQAVESRPAFVAPPAPGAPFSSADAPQTRRTNVNQLAPNQPTSAVTVTPTGNQPSEQKRGAAKPPKDKPAPSTTPGTDPFRAARQAVDQRAADAAIAAAKTTDPGQVRAAAVVVVDGEVVKDRWGQPVADPTTREAGSSKESSPPATEAQPTGSNVSSASSPTNSLASSSDASDTPADDFGPGEDPEDAAPAVDSVAAKLAEFRVFLAGCKSQGEMQRGFPVWRVWTVDMAKTDPRFHKDGEMTKLIAELWATRKGALPA